MANLDADVKEAYVLELFRREISHRELFPSAWALIDLKPTLILSGTISSKDR